MISLWIINILYDIFIYKSDLVTENFWLDDFTSRSKNPTNNVPIRI